LGFYDRTRSAGKETDMRAKRMALLGLAVLALALGAAVATMLRGGGREVKLRTASADTATTTTVTWKWNGQTFTVDDFAPGDNPQTNPAAQDPGWPGWSEAMYHKQHGGWPAGHYETVTSGPCAGKQKWVDEYGDSASVPGDDPCNFMTKEQFEAAFPKPAAPTKAAP
jgi:hypothetical protein